MLWQSAELAVPDVRDGGVGDLLYERRGCNDQQNLQSPHSGHDAQPRGLKKNEQQQVPEISY